MSKARDQRTGRLRGLSLADVAERPLRERKLARGLALGEASFATVK